MSTARQCQLLESVNCSTVSTICHFFCLLLESSYLNPVEPGLTGFEQLINFVSSSWFAAKSVEQMIVEQSNFEQFTPTQENLKMCQNGLDQRGNKRWKTPMKKFWKWHLEKQLFLKWRVRINIQNIFNFFEIFIVIILWEIHYIYIIFIIFLLYCITRFMILFK